MISTHVNPCLFLFHFLFFPLLLTYYLLLSTCPISFTLYQHASVSFSKTLPPMFTSDFCLCSLKEKLPQAFMQIGWMEDNFRNLTAKVWANLDNPIKRYDFSKVSLILCMSPLSDGTLLIFVMSQQYNCLLELYTKFY